MKHSDQKKLTSMVWAAQPESSPAAITRASRAAMNLVFFFISFTPFYIKSYKRTYISIITIKQKA